MRLTACDCRTEHYRVAHRHGWMRLVPTRRLYRCYGCDEFIFLPLVSGVPAGRGSVSPYALRPAAAR
jgi:hypothetical protein